MDIPILALKRQMNRAIYQLFEYRAGCDPEAVPPLLSFREEEQKEGDKAFFSDEKANVAVTLIDNKTFALAPIDQMRSFLALKATAENPFAGALQEAGKKHIVAAVSTSLLPGEAIGQYEQALKLDPGAGVVFEELADLYIQTGRLRDAITEAEELLKQRPDNLDARRMLGRIYTRLMRDEVLAELDIERRLDLLSRLDQSEQVLMSTTDLDLFDPGYVKNAVVWRVAGGRVEKA